jgi:hypothetical protein
MSLEHNQPDCTGRWSEGLIEELEHEVDALLARYRGRWHDSIHRAALLVLWAAVLCLWFVVRSFSAQVTG